MTILNGLTSKNKITQYKNLVYKLVLQIQVENLRDNFFFFLKKRTSGKTVAVILKVKLEKLCGAKQKQA